MNGGSITTNGINSYGAYANGKKAYINLDYVENLKLWLMEVMQLLFDKVTLI